MRGVNKAIIIGHLGADPEVHNFQDGGSITIIAVATSEKWTDKQTGQPKEHTEWHRISLGGRLGEIAAEYLRKGSPVYIEGKIRTRKYTDKNNQERYATDIRADQMQMLGSGGENQQDPTYRKNSPQQSNPLGGATQQNQAQFNSAGGTVTDDPDAIPF